MCPLLTPRGETANSGVRPLMSVSITCLHPRKSSGKRYRCRYVLDIFNHNFHVQSCLHSVELGMLIGIGLALEEVLQLKCVTTSTRSRIPSLVFMTQAILDYCILCKNQLIVFPLQTQSYWDILSCDWLYVCTFSV